MKRTSISILALAFVFVFSACRKLNVPVESQYVAGNFPVTSNDYAALLGTMYTNLSSNFAVTYWRMQELSTDEAILRTGRPSRAQYRPLQRSGQSPAEYAGLPGTPAHSRPSRDPGARLPVPEVLRAVATPRLAFRVPRGAFWGVWAFVGDEEAFVGNEGAFAEKMTVAWKHLLGDLVVAIAEPSVGQNRRQTRSPHSQSSDQSPFWL